VLAVRGAHAAGEEAGQPVVGPHAVVEGVDEALERVLAAGLFVERRHRSGV